MHSDHPFREPEFYQEAVHVYHNTWQGGVDDFSGREIIALDDKVIYQADCMGGLVGQ